VSQRYWLILELFNSALSAVNMDNKASLAYFNVSYQLNLSRTEVFWYLIVSYQNRQGWINRTIKSLPVCLPVRQWRPPLWSSGQSSWLQIQRSGFDSQSYQVFREVVGLERGPLSLVSIIEELLERKSCGSGLENRESGRRDPSRWPRGSIYQQKVGNHFADKRRSLGGSSSLADLNHGV
jgi:hypothetical protein